jgi:hypothetical protein
MTNPRGLASAGVKVDEQGATSIPTLRDATVTSVYAEGCARGGGDDG